MTILLYFTLQCYFRQQNIQCLAGQLTNLETSMFRNKIWEWMFCGMENLGRSDNTNFRAMFAKPLLCQLSWLGPGKSIAPVGETLSLKSYIQASTEISKVKGEKIKIFFSIIQHRIYNGMKLCIGLYNVI